MGKLKETLIDKRKQHDEALAEFLGLEIDELEILDYDINSNESADGVVYNRTIVFSEDNPVDLLKKIKGLYQDRYVDYCDWELEGDDFYDDFHEGPIPPFDLYFQKIEKVKRIINSETLESGLIGLIYQQCYVSIIGSVEAFLYENYISEYEADEESINRFIKGHPELKNKKIKFCDIIEEHKGIEKTIRKIVANTNFHNFPAVKVLYEKSFDRPFPDFSNLLPYIKLRHDIVHRGGKDIEGGELFVGKQLLESLLREAGFFVASVASSFGKAF